MTARKVLFIFIELRFSKKISKRARLACAVKTKSKSQLKVLFIFIELWLSARTTKREVWVTNESPFHFIELRLSKKKLKRDSLVFVVKRKLKWQLKQMKVLFISLNCDFQKDDQTRKFHPHFESKIQMTVESPFRFDWIMTFKKTTQKGQFSFCCENRAQMTVETNESPFHFIELRLSKRWSNEKISPSLWK